MSRPHRKGETSDSWVTMARCGLHSGIPKCCIRFYLRLWHPLCASYSYPYKGAWCLDVDAAMDGSIFFREYQKALDRYRKRHGDCRYIACPVCMEEDRAPVKILKCPEEV